MALDLPHAGSPLVRAGTFRASSLAVTLARARKVTIMPDAALVGTVAIRVRADTTEELDTLDIRSGEALRLRQSVSASTADVVVSGGNNSIKVGGNSYNNVFTGNGVTIVSGSNNVVNGRVVNGNDDSRNSQGSQGAQSLPPTLEIEISVPPGFALDLGLSSRVKVILGNVGGPLDADLDSRAELEAGLVGLLALRVDSNASVRINEVKASEATIKATASANVAVNTIAVDKLKLVAKSTSTIEVRNVTAAQGKFKADTNGRVAVGGGNIASLLAATEMGGRVSYGGTAVDAQLEASMSGNTRVGLVTGSLERSQSMSGVVHVDEHIPSSGMHR